MAYEIPKFERCCGCLPLRRGLLLWMYIKLVLLFLTLCISISYVFNTFDYFDVPMSIIFLIDIVFCILFVISAHKKNHKLMKVYYQYGVYMLPFGTIALLFLIGLGLFTVAYIDYTSDLLYLLAIFDAFIFVQLVLHAYVVLLVRSEVLKLERGTELKVINYSSGPECRAQIML